MNRKKARGGFGGGAGNGGKRTARVGNGNRERTLQVWALKEKDKNELKKGASIISIAGLCGAGKLVESLGETRTGNKI